jgi:hypothetical protein
MSDGDRSVFVNCPFDPQYRPFFYAMVFTIIRSGFIVRSALEADNAADNRLDKICRIIGECRYAVHDLSRTETRGDPPLPQFNMPLELGLFLGARKYGGAKHRQKSCIVFDRDKFRYQAFISDIAGQDIHSHGQNIATLVAELAGWLRMLSKDGNVPGGRTIAQELAEFNSHHLPGLLLWDDLDADEMTFADYRQIVTRYLIARRPAV